jgi:23S rRNA (uracil1939-C5)-methyltransferase
MIKGSIESIAFGGEGILRHEGLVIFVPFTAPGEVVEVEISSKKKKFARGKLLHLETSSSQRIEPSCPYFGSCGGCQLQHLNYPVQLEAKRHFISDALKRIGKLEIPEFTVSAATEQWHYRRHIRLKLRKERNGFKAGYIGNNPSVFVPIAQCPIFLARSGCGIEDPLLRIVQTLLLSLSSEGIEEGSVRIIKANPGKFILAFHFFPMLPNNFCIASNALEKYPSLQGIAMQSPNKQKEFGDIRCETQLLGLKARFSPFGFLQNHPQQSKVLYRCIVDALPNSTCNVLDLYCGVGITSLLFAKQQITAIGVEAHKETIALAKANADLNKISNVEFFEGKAEKLGVELLKKGKPDTVLCNPPRTGIDPMLLQALAKEKPPCILYVSCMPSTLARDLQKLTEAGYQIDSIQGFDMFPQTTHVETLVKLIL